MEIGSGDFDDFAGNAFHENGERAFVNSAGSQLAKNAGSEAVDVAGVCQHQ